jgi:hypothetical protein
MDQCIAPKPIFGRTLTMIVSRRDTIKSRQTSETDPESIGLAGGVTPHLVDRAEQDSIAKQVYGLCADAENPKKVIRTALKIGATRLF